MQWKSDTRSLSIVALLHFAVLALVMLAAAMRTATACPIVRKHGVAAVCLALGAGPVATATVVPMLANLNTFGSGTCSLPLLAGALSITGWRVW